MNIQKILILIALFISSTVYATQEDENTVKCEVIVSSRITIPASIPRVAISSVAENVYSLIEGEKSLSDIKPVLVIKSRGDDIVLAIDARKAFQMGLDEFFKKYLPLDDSEQSSNWKARVQAKFDKYTDPNLEVVGLAKLWYKIDKIRDIGRFFGVHFFNEDRRVSLNGFYSGPEKENRVVLISLVAPKTAIAPNAPAWKNPPPELIPPRRIVSTFPATVVPARLKRMAELVQPRLSPFTLSKLWDFGGPSGKLRISESLYDLIPSRDMRKYLHAELETLLRQKSKTLMKDLSDMPTGEYYVIATQKVPTSVYLNSLKPHTFLFYKDDFHRVFLVGFSETALLD